MQTETTTTTRTLDDVLAAITAAAQAQEIGRRVYLSLADGVHGLTRAELDAVAEHYAAPVQAYDAAEDHGAFRVAHVTLGAVTVKCFSRDV